MSEKPRREQARTSRRPGDARLSEDPLSGIDWAPGCWPIYTHPDDDGHDAGLPADRVLLRLVSHELDTGEGWVAVHPDPIGVRRNLPEYDRERLGPPPFPVTGAVMHLQCPSGRHQCEGCFEVTGFRDDFQTWLGQVPRVFGSSVIAARILALEDERAPVGPVVTIASATYEDGKIADIYASDDLPFLWDAA